MDEDIYAKAEFLRRGGYTRRYHGWRTIEDDPVGIHSYNVANLIQLIRPDCSKELLLAGIRHDAAEHVVGDMPSDSKRAIPGAKEMMDAAEAAAWERAGIADPAKALSKDEYRIMKLADYFDGMMYCLQERQMGNSLMDIVFSRYCSYMGTMLENQPFGVEHRLYNDICTAYVKAGGNYHVGQ